MQATVAPLPVALRFAPVGCLPGKRRAKIVARFHVRDGASPVCDIGKVLFVAHSTFRIIVTIINDLLTIVYK